MGILDMILVEELNTEFGNIKIMRSKSDGSHTYYQDKCLHSQINREGVSTCSYVHALYGILSQAGSRRVLMIGGAGGTLATMLHRRGVRVTVVDINPHAFALAKRYFQMPPDIACVVEDGATFVQRTTERYDAIVLDAFNGDGYIPEHLTGADFFRALGRVLDPGGLIAVNVMVEDEERYADEIAIHMGEAGFPVMLFDRPGRKIHNIIVAGGDVGHIRLPTGDEPAWIQNVLQGIFRRRPRK